VSGFYLQRSPVFIICLVCLPLTTDVNPKGIDVIEKIPDIMNEKYNFTDGCGFISTEILKEILPWLPSVIQIRYPGVKGILVKKLSKERFIQFRSESMIKFESHLSNPLGIVEYSKPFTYGALNKQIILLLLALGVSEQVLEAKQIEYYSNVSQMLFDPVSAWKINCLKHNNLNNKNKPSKGKSLQKKEMEKSKAKLRIPLLHSRY
jgi:hypothetical protein